MVVKICYVVVTSNFIQTSESKLDASCNSLPRDVINSAATKYYKLPLVQLEEASSEISHEEVIASQIKTCHDKITT